MGLGVHFHDGRTGLVTGKPMNQSVLFEDRNVSQTSRLGQRMEKNMRMMPEKRNSDIKWRQAHDVGAATTNEDSIAMEEIPE